MWTIFKVFNEFVIRLLLFHVLFFWPSSASWPGIEPTAHVLKGKVLTTGPPGKSLNKFCLELKNHAILWWCLSLGSVLGAPGAVGRMRHGVTWQPREWTGHRMTNRGPGLAKLWEMPQQPRLQVWVQKQTHAAQEFWVTHGQRSALSCLEWTCVCLSGRVSVPLGVIVSHPG